MDFTQTELSMMRQAVATTAERLEARSDAETDPNRAGILARWSADYRDLQHKIATVAARLPA